MTLENLAEAIQNTVDVIFPGSKQTKDTAEDVKKAVVTIVGYKAMAALNGLAVASEIIESYVKYELLFFCQRAGTEIDI